MKPPEPPRIDTRRTEQFREELLARARAWIPGWDLSEDQRDFGRALLEIAARFNAEVTERLDGAGEKMRRSFLDWLAVRREAARPSRVPVVFKLNDNARTPVLADAPVRLQADAAGVPVVFETEKDVRVIPGTMGAVVAVDADADAFYLPAPGLSDLQPLEPLPTEWQLKNFAAAKARKLQITPDAGLAPGMIVEGGGWHYEIAEVDKEIITVKPPLTTSLETGTILRKVTVFAPYEAGARNLQEHALFVGHMDLLNLEAEATIDVVGLASLAASVKWQYWGKVAEAEEPGWQTLTLAATQKNDAVVLKKPFGSVDLKEINGISSRWIRAYAVKAEGNPLQVDSIRLRINCQPDAVACPPVGTEPPSPAAQAMANTTPLVLDTPFLPLGKEPRTFDAFYLGSQEAFSKKDAQAQLCFELADSTFASLSPVRNGHFTNTALAGVGRDRALHLLSCDSLKGALARLWDRPKQQPPAPAYNGGQVQGDVIQLDPQPAWRLPVWTEDDHPSGARGFVVAMPAGDSVWAWHENPDPTLSGWIPFGQLPADTQTPPNPIDGLVFLSGTTKRLAALRNGHVFVREWPDGQTWKPVATKQGMNDVRLKFIGAVHQVDDSGLFDSTAELIGLSENGKLFEVDTSEIVTPDIWECTPLLAARTFAAVAPVACRAGAANRTIVAVQDGSPLTLVALDSVAGESDAELSTGAQLVGSLDLTPVAPVPAAKFMVTACLQQSSQARTVATWIPLDASPIVFETQLPANVPPPGGGPVRHGFFLVLPTTSTSILVAKLDLKRRKELFSDIRTALVTRDDRDHLVVNDFVAIPIPPPSAMSPPSAAYELQQVTTSGVRLGNRRLDEFAVKSRSGSVFVYHAATPALTAKIHDKNALNKIKLPDTQFGQGDLLLITTDKPTTGLYVVLDFTAPIATLDRALEVASQIAPPLTVQYQGPEATQVELHPLLHLSGASADWDASVLKRTRLAFPGADPELQKAEAFQVDNNGRPEMVLVAQPWDTADAPPNTMQGELFIVDGSVGEWVAQLGATFTNPELSWEYWNGKGWWGLPITVDTTRDLTTSGAVQFKVPGDLPPSDWAGQTNRWIRARLVAGDYGREKVTVVTKTNGNTSEQTVNRSTDDIRAPSVVRLHISYQLCEAVLPGFVVAQDSGSYRDQSDANDTPGALVEAFVPLGVALARLGSGGAPAAETTDDCPPPCRCAGDLPITAAGTSGGPTDDSPTLVDPAPVTGRAVLIGVSSPPSDAPVNMLMLVDRERDYSALSPMKIEALVADRFVPIVADDTTRAMGESGVLSMSFAVPPTPRELFGRTLSWLRLTPEPAPATGAGAGLAWSPTLRGAYLNAVWASATETLTRELLGSSDGAPRMAFTLARPPVLMDTLELRVREPLGDEEREELRANGDDVLLSSLPELPGDWVLWTRVTDPADEGPDARVYALDDATGQIVFGDGLHGMIPPIGRDSIVAFSYQRTETGASAAGTVPGNTLVPRTPFNLVSPVEGVETVIAADRAAGGAPPESDDRVLRFGFAGLRHRRRAVTARDIEDLALQSSPDIAQARALVRRGHVRLIIVMSGANPQPNASQLRELRRFLLDASPIALAAPGALRLEGPAVRALRLDLTLLIPRLDDAGDVGRDVKTRLVQLFDTATGGAESLGWPLGESPSEGDVAYALMDIANLESIAAVALHEVAGRRTDAPWPATLKPHELARLADDPVRLQFLTAEVTV